MSPLLILHKMTFRGVWKSLLGLTASDVFPLFFLIFIIPKTPTNVAFWEEKEKKKKKKFKLF